MDEEHEGDATRTLVRWPERRGLSKLLRVLATVLPVVLSTVLTFGLSRLLPTPSGIPAVLLQWVVLSLLATGVLLVLQALGRRLLPLATMAGLGLVFPDRVPSRIQMAMHTGSVTDLDGRLHKARMTGAAGDETAAAEGLLELLGDLNNHDRRTRGHSERVRAISQLIAEEMGVAEGDRDLLNWSALLHDVGKLEVSRQVLGKTEPLDGADWVELHGHPAAGARLVRPLASWLGPWLTAVGQHHERWDGHGYPEGLAGEDIGLAARIVAVADAFDAMTAPGGPGERLSTDAARSELASAAGSQFDPRVVRAFLAIGIGRLRLAMGPMAWLANLPIVGRIPITPAISAVFGAGVAATALVTGGAGTQADAAVDAPPLAVAEPLAEPSGADPTVGPTPPGPTVGSPTPTPDDDPPVAPPPSPGPPVSPAPTDPPVIGPTPPLASDLSVLVTEDGSVDIDLGKPKNLTIPDGPDHGTLTDLGGGRYRYKPAPNYHGADQFTYERCADAQCGTGVVRITVAGVNDAPSAATDSAAGLEDDPIDIAVLGNDNDVDGDTLRVTSVSGATGGTAAILPNGKVRFTPAPDVNGGASFGYRVSDDNGGTDTASVTVNLGPVNDPPSFTAGADESVLEDAGAQSVPGWATGVGPGPGDESGQSVTFTAVADAPGLFATQPAVSATGQLTYTPAPNANGTALVTVNAVDDGGTADGGDDTSPGRILTITIGAVNDPPVANDDGGLGFATSEDTPFTTGSVVANDVDVDSPIDPASVFVTSYPAHGDLIDNGDGTFDYDPDPDWSGADSFGYTITDPEPLASNVATVTVTVGPVNDAPEVVDPGPQIAAEETPFTLQVDATDIELDALSYGAVGLPAGLSIDGTGLISGTPDPGTQGSYDVDVTVTDDGAPPEATIVSFSLDVGLHLRSPDAGGLVVNEVLYNTVSAAAPEEFIELHNRSGSPIDLTGSVLADANLKADGPEDLGYTIPATDHWGVPSTLAPGEYAVVWVVHDGVTLPPLANLGSGLEYVVGVPGVKLADTGDDIWLLDPDTRIVDYMAYGGGVGVGTAPEAGLGLWDATFQGALATAAAESVVVTPDGADRDGSACWEPTASDDAAGRCGPALPTYDSDAMVALATSAGLNNNALGADAGGPYAIVEGDPLDLDGSATPGPPTSWAWDLDGDGQYDDATGSTPSVPWSTLASLGVDDDGDYPVALQVDGGPGSAYTTVAIDNTSPVLSTTGDATVVTGLVYTLDLAAIDPGDDTISSWTVNWGDGTIETIAGDPGSLTHTYSRSGFTFDILASATDEDGTYLQNELLAPSYDGDTVFRFEETTGAFLQEFGSVDDPIETTIGPDGRLYVSGEKSDNVVRYNAQTGAFVDEFVTPGRGGLDSPEGLAFGPDGNLYVADYTANRVLRFDGTTGAFVDVFADTGLTRPYDLVFGPDSNLYVGNYSADEVVRLDGTTGAFIDVFVAGSSGGLDTPEQMAFGPDGNLYVASFNGDEVLRFDGTTGAFVDVFVAAGGVEDLDRPAGLAFGPDGNLYVGDHRDHLVLRYDGASGAFLDEYVAPGAGGLTKPGPMAFLPEQQVTVTRPPPVTALEVANGTAHTCHTASDTPVRCRPATVRGAGASGKTVSWVSDR